MAQRWKGLVSGGLCGVGMALAFDAFTIEWWGLFIFWMGIKITIDPL